MGSSAQPARCRVSCMAHLGTRRVGLGTAAARKGARTTSSARATRDPFRAKPGKPAAPYANLSRLELLSVIDEPTKRRRVSVPATEYPQSVLATDALAAAAPQAGPVTTPCTGRPRKMIHRFPGRAGPRGAGPPPESGTVRGRQRMDDHRGAQFTGRVTAHPPRDGTLVTDLVTRASTGDKQAWDALVERYAPLIWSICGRYRISRADAEDVGQSVWLRLAGQLDKIRDPAALPGWLATTTSRECGRVGRTARGPHVPGPRPRHRESSGPAGQRGRPGIARGRASRGAMRRTQPLAAGRPAADRLAHR